MCAIIMSHVLLPCDITLVDLTAAWSTGVATMSSLAQLGVQEWRQPTHKDARLIKIRNARSKQLLVMPTKKLTD